MSGGDDWRVGDLALCIDDAPGRRNAGKVDGRWHCESINGQLRKGAIYTVWKVKFFPGPPAVLAMKMHEVDGPWLANRFRKIHPHAPDAEDRETIALLTGQPATVEA